MKKGKNKSKKKKKAVVFQSIFGGSDSSETHEDGSQDREIVEVVVG